MSDPFDDKEARAADYVLGTLGSAERKEVEASLASDEDLAARVEQWSRRLLPLAQALPPVEPPPSVWRTIERTLDRDLERRPESRLVTDLKAAQGALRRRLALWRWSALVAGTVAATLALYIAITGIWWIVNAIIMLKERQQISGLRATCAVVPGPLVATTLAAGVIDERAGQDATADRTDQKIDWVRDGAGNISTRSSSRPGFTLR